MISISNVNDNYKLCHITGGTGFVGKWMRKLQPYNMIAYYYNRVQENRTGWYKKNANYIVHLAPVAPTFAIECARRNNARLLYASSGAVYHPEYQDKEYRSNKIKWEQECLDSGVDVVIARLFTFMDSSRAYNAIFSAVRGGKRPQIATDCVRSFMHGREMARWLWAILLQGENGHAYDVGSDRAYTMIELAKRIQAFTGCGYHEYLGPVAMPTYLPPNIAKTKALL